MNAKRSSDAGLSLIEVLVSLAIFAIIGIAGLAVLNTVARTGERTDGKLDRLAEIDRAFLVIRRDLAQVAAGNITLDGDVLTFRRAAQDQAVNVTYLLENTMLLRRIALPVGAPVDQQLLTQVTMAEWRLMDGRQSWQSGWPTGPNTPGNRPHAAELTLDLRSADAMSPQTITRLIVLPAGQSR